MREMERERERERYDATNSALCSALVRTRKAGGTQPKSTWIREMGNANQIGAR